MLLVGYEDAQAEYLPQIEDLEYKIEKLENENSELKSIIMIYLMILNMRVVIERSKMKKFFLFLLLFMILNPPAIAGLFDEIDREVLGEQAVTNNAATQQKGLFDEIDREVEAKYGRSSSPSSAGSQRIKYGYNAVGKYAPSSIGNKRVNYSYNAVGDYVPTSIGNQRVNYSYNAVGDYVPTSIGGQRIQYGYNAMGDYVPMSVGGRRIKYDFNAYGDYVPMGY